MATEITKSQYTAAKVTLGFLAAVAVSVAVYFGFIWGAWVWWGVGLIGFILALGWSIATMVDYETQEKKKGLVR